MDGSAGAATTALTHWIRQLAAPSELQLEAARLDSLLNGGAGEVYAASLFCGVLLAGLLLECYRRYWCEPITGWAARWLMIKAAVVVTAGLVLYGAVLHVRPYIQLQRAARFVDACPARVIEVERVSEEAVVFRCTHDRWPMLGPRFDAVNRLRAPMEALRQLTRQVERAPPIGLEVVWVDGSGGARQHHTT